MYDFLIVGAGLYGSVVARELTDYGYKCVVIDKRKQIGGNCYTEKQHGIDVHKFGPHIFHTDSEEIWNYVNRFTEFNNFVNRPKVNFKEKIFSFPINLMTFYQIDSSINTPSKAKEYIEKHVVSAVNDNFEEWALSKMSKEMYQIFIEGYTKKQWNKHPKELPSSIIKRIPIRFNYDDNYFYDKFQGIPVNGYTSMIEKMLSGIEVKVGINFIKNRHLENIANKIIYTGCIDEFFDYKFGKLEYRGLKFETSLLAVEDYQGNAIVNFTSLSVPYTRIVEHKHFNTHCQKDLTIITKEFPSDEGTYYPINDEKNNRIYKQYLDYSSSFENVCFGGRLGEYKYYDMHQVIRSAIQMAQFLQKTHKK